MSTRMKKKKPTLPQGAAYRQLREVHGVSTLISKGSERVWNGAQTSRRFRK